MTLENAVSSTASNKVNEYPDLRCRNGVFISASNKFLFGLMGDMGFFDGVIC